jgi:hypothetical protein
MEILSKENENEIGQEDNDSLLKIKKKPRTNGQLKALTAMNDARTKKAEAKLKIKYEKIIAKENIASAKALTKVPKTKTQPPASSVATRQPQPHPPSDTESDVSASSSSSEEIQIIHKPKRCKEKKPKKKTKKIIIMESSSSESEEEEEEIHHHPTRQMRTQQNRKTVIQQHNQKQISKDFFCS